MDPNTTFLDGYPFCWRADKIFGVWIFIIAFQRKTTAHHVALGYFSEKQIGVVV